VLGALAKLASRQRVHRHHAGHPARRGGRVESASSSTGAAARGRTGRHEHLGDASVRGRPPSGRRRPRSRSAANRPAATEPQPVRADHGRADLTTVVSRAAPWRSGDRTGAQAELHRMPGHLGAAATTSRPSCAGCSKLQRLRLASASRLHPRRVEVEVAHAVVLRHRRTGGSE
jgi:hypothetical protein